MCFPKRPFSSPNAVYDGIGRLIVCCVMFDGDGYAVLLDPIDVLGSYEAAQGRIFAESLKASAYEG